MSASFNLLKRSKDIIKSGFHLFKPGSTGALWQGVEDSSQLHFQLAKWEAQKGLTTEAHTSCFGFVAEGETTLTVLNQDRSPRGQFTLIAGMFFRHNGPCDIKGGDGMLVHVLSDSKLPDQGMFSLGGPIESTGNLRYVDGCSDSLLLSPYLYGMSCLNHLHFPVGIDQTPHTHPSDRLGMVVKGHGLCHLEDEVVPLIPGRTFVIGKDTKHKFSTTESTMDVIAWHPDSDFGPLDDDHPMINRTIVDGISANQLTDIRTSGDIRDL
jgi:quercetin dioxygenase-like cupin family protein